MNYHQIPFYIENQLRNIAEKGNVVAPDSCNELCSKDYNPNSCLGQYCQGSSIDLVFQTFNILSLEDKNLQQQCYFAKEYQYYFAIIDPSDSSVSVTITTTTDCGQTKIGNPTALLLLSNKCYVWKAPSDDTNPEWLALQYNAKEKTLSVTYTCDPSSNVECKVDTCTVYPS